MSDATETYANPEAEEMIETLTDIGQRMNRVAWESDVNTRLRIISVASNIGRISSDMEGGLRIYQGNS